MRRYVAPSAGFRKSAPAGGAGRVEVARPGPGREELGRALDRRPDPLVQRVAVLRVPDREREDVLEPPRPELAEQEQPAAEGAGHARGEEPRAGDQVVAELAEALDRRRGGRDPWPQSASGSRGSRTRRPPGPRRRGPFRCGSTTWSVNPVAHAASNALPPRSSTDIPTAEASQCVEATIPNVPRSSGRVVKAMEGTLICPA